MSAPTFARLARSLDPRPTQPFVLRFRRAIQALDFAVVLAATVLVVLIPFAGMTVAQDGSRQILAVALVVAWPIMLWQRQSTATTILGNGLQEYRRVIVASGAAGVVVAAFGYVSNTTRSRGFLAVAIVVGTLMLLVERHLMRKFLHRIMATGRPLHRVFVIACPQREAGIRASLGAGDRRFEEVGFWHLSELAEPDPRDVVAAALAERADTILYAPLGTQDPQWTRHLGWAMEESDLSLLVSPSLVEIAGPRLSVEPVEGLAFVRVEMPRFSGPALLAKRALDIVGSLLCLVLLGIPMLVVAAWIRLDSPGPALFRQVRAGVRSTTFTCWKFRTMHQGADAERAALRAALQGGPGGGAGATFKMAGDPRVTRAGRFLRRYSIDELPQLINVLRGQMSLVGPRPHPLDDVELYDDLATRRLLAKPGMTGLWQVSGRSDLDWEQAVRLDVYYVENWSLAVDLLILMRTVKVVLTGSGAY